LDCEPATDGEPTAGSEAGVNFPRKLRHKGRGKPLATIYKRGPHCYRVTWRVRSDVDGKSVGTCKEFPTYAKARKFGEDRVEELAKDRTVRLTTGQLTGAVAAFKLLQDFNTENQNQKAVPLLECIAGYCGALKRLRKHSSPLTVTEALDAYLATVATVKRKDIAEAVEEWLADRERKTVATKPGKRPQLSSGYHYNCGLVLREFAKFTKSPEEFAKSREELVALTKGWKEIPVGAVCDLGKEHIDGYVALHAGLAPKSRNERRMMLKMWLKWAVAKDYLQQNHRLLEAHGMTRELNDDTDIESYTATELQAMLDRASKAPPPVKEGEEPEADYRPLLPIIALVGLGGIRLAEAVRLTWLDVWHVEGHIEVSVAKSKTRLRRLSTMCASLAQWLEPYRHRTGKLWTACLDHFHREFEEMLGELEIPVRRNALRHGFVSAHYALHSDEGLTAKESGNSPEVVHANYKRLMTKEQGRAWFAVAPERPANVVQLGT